jgi:hypothetical protein
MSMLIPILGVLGVLLAADLYLHKKYERTAAVNVWGYRGPPIGRKSAGETRVAVLGGSTAFGYGPYWDGAFPFLLERRLNATGRGRYSVVNLAYNNEGAYSLRFTLEDYTYLDYDIAILYEGYNDLTDAPQFQVFRRQSPIFRLTGYFPIFPMIAREKAYALLYGGNISQGYAEGKTVFSPGLTTRATARALELAAATATSLERQVGRMTVDTTVPTKISPTDACAERWFHYCGSMQRAIEWARARGKGVLVGTQPYLSDIHVDQQRALAGLLRRFESDKLIRHVNLGRAVDLKKNPHIAYDGVHLTAEGNDVIASGLVQPVLDMTDLLRR